MLWNIVDLQASTALLRTWQVQHIFWPQQYTHTHTRAHAQRWTGVSKRPEKNLNCWFLWNKTNSKSSSSWRLWRNGPKGPTHRDFSRSPGGPVHPCIHTHTWRIMEGFPYTIASSDRVRCATSLVAIFPWSPRQEFAILLFLGLTGWTAHFSQVHGATINYDKHKYLIHVNTVA